MRKAGSFIRDKATGELTRTRPPTDVPELPAPAAPAAVDAAREALPSPAVAELPAPEAPVAGETADTSTDSDAPRGGKKKG